MAAKMASLADGLEEKRISERKKILSKFLKDNEVGQLSEDDEEQFRHIFQQFYTPEEQHEKFENKDIVGVHIGLALNNKCFKIMHIDNLNELIPASKKYLAGSQRTTKQSIAGAARLAIRPQINEWKETHRLNVDGLCPIKHCRLGTEAQVDHEILFKDLLEDWRKESGAKDLKTKYNSKLYDHEFTNPATLDSWRAYHQTHAKLRWASKEGNQGRSKSTIVEDTKQGELEKAMAGMTVKDTTTD